MCGIIAGFNKNHKNKKHKTEKINDYIINQYQDQCSRGTRGFGIIRIAENGKIELDRATQDTKFLLDLYMKPSRMIIAHHRQPTASDNKLNQTHPISISNKILKYDYYFVHNGVLSNDKQLKEKHEKLGFKYITEHITEGYWENAAKIIKFNDSEALGIEVALFIEEIQPTIETDNSAAFIALQIDKKTQKATKVFFGRSGISSCLNLSIKKGKIRISSEGEGEEVIVNTLQSFDPKDPKMKITSKEMIFKEKEKPKTELEKHIDTQRHIHQNPLPVGTIKTEETKLLENTTSTTGNKTEIITLEERSWNKNKIDESTTEVDYIQEEYDDIFIDKNYQEETLQQFNETIKDDDSEMIETSLEIALDEQSDRIEKIINHFKQTIQNREIDRQERGFYLSQTCKILVTMEAIAKKAEEDYDEKQIQEEIKEEETKSEEDPYDVSHMGYRVGQKFHNYRTGEMEEVNKEDYMGYNRFG